MFALLVLDVVVPWYLTAVAPTARAWDLPLSQLGVVGMPGERAFMAWSVLDALLVFLFGLALLSASLAA